MKVVLNETDIKKAIRLDMEEKGFTVEEITINILHPSDKVVASVYVKNDD